MGAMTMNDPHHLSILQAIADICDELVYVCSPDHRLEFVNHRVKAWLGRDPAGETCHKTIFGEDGPCAWCTELVSLEGNSVRREFRHPDTGRWYTSITTALYPSTGTVSRLTVLTDITDKKQVQTAFLESERRLATLMNILPGMVYRCRADESFTMEFASHGSKRLLGFEPHELLGTGPAAYQRIVHPEDRKNMLDLVRQTVAKRRPFSFIYRIRAASGDEKWVWEQGEGVFDAHDQLVALEGFICDVTAYKEVELDLRKENMRLRSSISDRYRFGDIIGKSKSMQAVYDLILKAAASDASVIIFGESGSGKELVARAIHQLSDRRKDAFVAVNCGAIPKELMEREFFGHLKGAFTGATADKQGFLDSVDGGTLFLDEIGEIAQSMQVKLLRVLDGMGYTPLGGVKLKQSNFRVIAATNRDLVKLVKDGRMREDFFYRIRILPITLPPLRERREDIPLLIDHFLSKMSKGKDAPRHLPVRVREALETYDWPGNVRELQNVLHSYITLGKLDLMGQIGMPARSDRDPDGFQPSDNQGLRQRLDALEKQMIINALDAVHWHRARAAEALQLNYKTLQRRMKGLGIK